MGQVNDKVTPRKPGPQAKQTYEQQRGTFIQYELSKEQAAACKATSFSYEDAWTQAQELAESGYRITVKFDDYSEAYAAFISAPQKGVNAGLILTGRGSSCFKALKQALFKHYTIMDGDWTGFAVRKQGVEIDD